ncbi:hypothetical protein [Streptomyces sp. NPDC054995]
MAGSVRDVVAVEAVAYSSSLLPEDIAAMIKEEYPDAEVTADQPAGLRLDRTGRATMPVWHVTAERRASVRCGPCGPVRRNRSAGPRRAVCGVREG